MFGPLLELMTEAERHEEDDDGHTIVDVDYDTLQILLTGKKIFLSDRIHDDSRCLVRLCPKILLWKIPNEFFHRDFL